MKEGNERQISNLYWLNFFPYNYKDAGEPLADPFHIKAGESLYFRLSPHFEEWSNVIYMKLLLEINAMYTTAKLDEYKLRQEAQYVLKQKSGRLGYYAGRVSRIFFGLFNYVVIVALVGVQLLV